MAKAVTGTGKPAARNTLSGVRVRGTGKWAKGVPAPQSIGALVSSVGTVRPWVPGTVEDLGTTADLFSLSAGTVGAGAINSRLAVWDVGSNVHLVAQYARLTGAGSRAVANIKPVNILAQQPAVVNGGPAAARTGSGALQALATPFPGTGSRGSRGAGSAPAGTAGTTGQSITFGWYGAPTPQFTYGVASSYSLLSVATSPAGDPITFSSIGAALPASVTINNTTKALDYDSGGSAAITAGVRLRATSTGGSADSASFSLRIAGQPNLAALPVASGQVLDDTAYAAALPSAGNNSYLDPLTSVRVWRMTSASYPVTNANSEHAYGDNGPNISRRWGAALDRYTMSVYIETLGEWRLVDFQRGVGFSNWRAWPAGAVPFTDVSYSFSNVEGYERIAYVWNGTQIVRVDTATGAIANTGNFPKSLGSGLWLHQDRNDEWFVKITSGTEVTAWNSQTNTTLARTFTGLDEPHLERDGRYVAVIAGGGASWYVWDLDTDAVSSALNTTTSPQYHTASLRGYWRSADSDVSAPFHDVRQTPSSIGPTSTATNIQAPSMGVYMHGSGCWIQATSDTSQYALVSTYNRGPGVPAYFPGTAGIMDSRNLLQCAIGYQRLDGGDHRILCHSGSLYDVGDYYEMPRATISPCGTLVMFGSGMQNSGRRDVFVAEVPLA